MTLLFLFLQATLAYETDQLTDRHEPLRDALEAANEAANQRLADAVTATNDRTQCRASEHRTRQVLAREIHNRTGKTASIPSRGVLRAPGFTVYSVWMETDDAVDRREFLAPRTDIFSELTVVDAAILATAGTSSTVRLAGVTMGSDKPDHFWDLGYAYLKKSSWGAHPERGTAHGVATEYGIYGMATSRTFSWADLAANQAGYTWYERLLTSESELQRSERGCVVQVADFDWAAWVTWEWDEVLNPSKYAPVVERGIQRHLAEHRAAYCASFEVWANADTQTHLDRVLDDTPPYADGAPTDRTDPFRLSELCSTHGTDGAARLAASVPPTTN